jgi:transcriptional regulator with XRE-family HTH domain
MAKHSSFGSYIRKLRVEAHISLRELAEKMNISHVYLGEVERGVRPPFKKERWKDLIRYLPGLDSSDLERQALLSKPVQLDLADQPPRYQDLTLALARRIQQMDLSEKEMRQLMRVLRGSKDE